MRLFLSSLFICITSILIYSYSNDFLAAIDILKANLSPKMTTTNDFHGLPVVPPEDPSLKAAQPVPRAINYSFEAIEQEEGAGARVRRSIGTPKLRNYAPFLMLDHFSVDVGAGFPDHPHRGQETITYLLEGAVDHEDFAGNKGTISYVFCSIQSSASSTLQPLPS